MIGAIIQARMGSTRLPGKVLLPLGNKPMLLFMIDRIKKASEIEKVVVATTTNNEDNVIAQLCYDNNIICYRGSCDNVADRYINAAYENGIDIIVRLTADCPLIDPETIDACIRAYEESLATYIANTVPPDKRTFPDGSDVEVFSCAALHSLMLHSCITESDLEHVTHAFWKNEITSALFRCTLRLQMKNVNLAMYRYTVDYPEDYELVKELVKELEDRGLVGTTIELCNILKEKPELFKLNSEHVFGEGWHK